MEGGIRERSGYEELMVNFFLLTWREGENGVQIIRFLLYVCLCAHVSCIMQAYIHVQESKCPWRVLCGNVRYGTEKSNLWVRYLFGWLISKSIKIN